MGYTEPWRATKEARISRAICRRPWRPESNYGCQSRTCLRTYSAEAGSSPVVETDFMLTAVVAGRRRETFRRFLPAARGWWQGPALGERTPALDQWIRRVRRCRRFESL